MHPGATLDEVADLAHTMSLKNTLQDPQFGGGKGGIRYDPSKDDAPDVLRRFMMAHREIIRTIWSTGADLYTDTITIERIARDHLGLPSAFNAMAGMISQYHGTKNVADAIQDRLLLPWNEYFSIGDYASGYSVAEVASVLTPSPSRVVIQGFGAVGSSLACHLVRNEIAMVIGICERDGLLANQNGIDIEYILRKKHEGVSTSQAMQELAKVKPKDHIWIPRTSFHTEDDLLCHLIERVSPDMLSPCAHRYTITPEVLAAFSNAQGKYIVCGANNAFASKSSAESLESIGITAVPEWVSNAGAALLFSEALKAPNWSREIADAALLGIRKNVTNFVQDGLSREGDLYSACRDIALGQIDRVRGVSDVLHED